jgi:hypothetical protein
VVQQSRRDAVGDVKWAWYDAREGIPGPYSTLYESGTFTPAGGERSGIPSRRRARLPGTGSFFCTCHLTSPQTTGNYWVILASDGNAGDVYSDGPHSTSSGPTRPNPGASGRART